MSQSSLPTAAAATAFPAEASWQRGAVIRALPAPLAVGSTSAQGCKCPLQLACWRTGRCNRICGRAGGGAPPCVLYCNKLEANHTPYLNVSNFQFAVRLISCACLLRGTAGNAVRSTGRGDAYATEDGAMAPPASQGRGQTGVFDICRTW